MNTSSRVPGISRNTGWNAVDAEIAARKFGVVEPTFDCARQHRPIVVGPPIW